MSELNKMKNKDMSEKNVTKNKGDRLNPIEARVKDVISQVEYDQSFKDHLAGRLEATIDNLSQDKNMKNKQTKKKKKGFASKWPFLALPALGAFALMVWGVVVLYDQYTSEPETTFNDPGNTTRDALKEISSDEINLDLVSERVFEEEVHECYDSCSAEEMVEKALEVSSDIHSYKVKYSNEADNKRHFVTGYQNFKEEARYLHSNVSFEAPYTREELIFGDSKIVRKFDEDGNWISNDRVKGDFDIELYGYEASIGFIGENGWVADSYEITSPADEHKVVTVKGHSEIASGGSSAFDFNASVFILPNMNIERVSVRYTPSENPELAEHKVYEYSDFEKNYAIYNPKLGGLGIFDNYEDGKAMYDAIMEEAQWQIEKGGSYMVIYKGDEEEPFNYARGYEYSPLGNPGRVTIPYGQYTVSFPIGKKQEVYIGDTKYDRDYVRDRGEWTNWNKTTSEDGWEADEFRRYNPGLILEEYSENSDWEIQGYEMKDGISDQQKVVVVDLQGTGENDGRAAELQVTQNSNTVISRIEVRVEEDGDYLYKNSYDYFKKAQTFEDEIEDPDGILKEAYDELRPDHEKDDSEDDKSNGEQWGYRGETFSVERKDFGVEYRPGEEEVATLRAKMPSDAEIVSKDGTRIQFKSLELVFTLPHMELPKEFESFQVIENSNINSLARVSVDPFGSYYVSNSILSGTCESPDGTFEAPCGPRTINMGDGLYIMVKYEGSDSEDLFIADKIMKSLELVESE
jgi:hypothetical protein